MTERMDASVLVFVFRKSADFWDVRCVVQRVLTDVLEEYTAFIHRVKEYTEQATSKKPLAIYFLLDACFVYSSTM
jgi:hypothetical protein